MEISGFIDFSFVDWDGKLSENSRSEKMIIALGSVGLARTSDITEDLNVKLVKRSDK